MSDTLLIYVAIGERIRLVRRIRKMRQAALAQRLGLSRASVVNIEAGRQALPLVRLYQIALILNCEMEALLPTLDEATMIGLTLDTS